MISVDILSALSGLGIFLFALRFLTSAIDESVSNRIEPFLNFMSKGTIRPLGIGIFSTLGVQASSITILSSMGILAKNLISLEKAIIIMLGATIGTTLKAWFFAFQFEIIGPMLILLSSVGLLFVKQHYKRKALEIALSIGLMFLGWKMLGSGLEPIASSPTVTKWLVMFQGDNFSSLLLSLLMGVLMTAMVQSSSTVIFILIGLATTHNFPLLSGIAIILGANIGTTFAVILASLEYGSEVRKLALAHFLVKFTGAIMSLLLLKSFLIVINVIFFGQLVHFDIATKLAAIHTGFNIVNTFIWLTLLPLLTKALNYIVASDEKHFKIWISGPLRNILTQNPRIALDEISKEWKVLKENVKACEDNTFAPLLKQKSKQKKMRYMKVREDIKSIEKILLGVLMRNQNFSSQVTHHLTKFGQLKLILDEILNINSILETIPDKSLDSLGETLITSLNSIAEKRNELWLAILTDKSIDTQKINSKMLKKLEEQMIFACKDMTNFNRSEIMALYNLSMALLSHLQRLIALVAPTNSEKNEIKFTVPKKPSSENFIPEQSF